jgi:hypothetical protein
MAYQDPKRVDSPRRWWRLIEVLWDGGEGEDSLAIGMWANKPVLAMRWNGSSKEGVIGNPQSRGLPTWFVLPEWSYGSVLDAADLGAAELARAKAILGV